MKHWTRLCALALWLPLMAAHAASLPLLPSLRDLDSLPMHATAATALQKSLVAPVDAKFANLRYGVVVPLPLSLADGVWDTPEPGVARWRTRVFSAGAQSLSLAFSQFQLPPSASFWIYDSKGTLVQGPYTGGMASPEGTLSTALVQDETAVLELRLPSDERDQAVLQLKSVSHGTRDISKAGIGGGTAGSCNIDVVCSQGDNYRNEIRSVGVYTVDVGSSSLICSGQLINNMRQDATPYFLTANHCGLSSSDAASMVVYWNFQSSSCGTGSGSLSQNQTGATYLASEAKSDFALVRLNQQPNTNPGAYYIGWDVTDTPPTSGVAIHHPEGDVKKISIYGSGTTAQDNACAGTDNNGNCVFPVQAWQVRWMQGTTEGGSSGSGLLNQNKRLIGVLSGGGASCSSQTSPDFFGRIAKAWQAGCTSSTQLRAWLDPDSSGRTDLCSQNPGTPCNSSVRTTGSTAPGTVASTGACAAGGTQPIPTPKTPSSGGAFGLSLLAGLLLPLLWRRRAAAAVKAA